MAGTRPASPEGASWGQLWRRIRVLVLLAVLAVVGIHYLRVRQAESWVSDWAGSEGVSVTLLLPPGTGEDGRDLAVQLQALSAGSGEVNFERLSEWFSEEFSRFRPDRPGFRPLSITVRGPHATTALPPDPPRAETGAVERTRAMQSFLDYFDELEAFELNAVYVIFYPQSEAQRFAHVHSIADRRSRRGFVFAPLTEAGLELAVIDTAHELLHLFGASDKYEGNRCSFPEGYYEPFLDPVHPQRFAEVMALGIPQSLDSKEVSNFSFGAIRVGTRTAQEIGWIDAKRATRYYDQHEVAAGPRPE